MQLVYLGEKRPIILTVLHLSLSPHVFLPPSLSSLPSTSDFENDLIRLNVSLSFV